MSALIEVKGHSQQPGALEAVTPLRIWNLLKHLAGGFQKRCRQGRDLLQRGVRLTLLDVPVGLEHHRRLERERLQVAALLTFFAGRRSLLQTLQVGDVLAQLFHRPLLANYVSVAAAVSLDCLEEGSRKGPGCSRKPERGRGARDPQRLDPLTHLTRRHVLDSYDELVVSLRDAVEGHGNQSDDPTVCGRRQQARLSPAHHIAVATAQFVGGLDRRPGAAMPSHPEDLELTVERVGSEEFAMGNRDGPSRPVLRDRHPIGEQRRREA